MTTDLDKLSEAATQGAWEVAHVPYGHIVHGPAMVFIAELTDRDADTTTQLHADALLISALVNMLRSGDLIPRATHEAAIAEARREERDAICLAIRREADLVGDDTEPLVEGQLSVIDLIAALPNPHDTKDDSP